MVTATSRLCTVMTANLWSKSTVRGDCWVAEPWLLDWKVSGLLFHVQKYALLFKQKEYWVKVDEKARFGRLIAAHKTATKPKSPFPQLAASMPLVGTSYL
jgi:hypothetical protein